MGNPSRRQSLSRVFQKYLSHYRDNNITYLSITASSILFGLNSFSIFRWQGYVFGVGVFICMLFSLVYTYQVGKPFGIDINCTPTHLVNGERQPDKMSEQRGIAMIQNGQVVLHGNVELSRFTDQFEFVLDTSSEINAELRTKPRKEHKYDPVENTLSCDNVSEYEFPLIIELFPERSVADGGRYSSLKLVDGYSDHVLIEYNVLNVDP